MHHCEVALIEDAGLVTFRVWCLYNGEVIHDLRVLQTEIEICLRRWMYEHVDPTMSQGEFKGGK
jgi:hypothetical protein